MLPTTTTIARTSEGEGEGEGLSLFLPVYHYNYNDNRTSINTTKESVSSVVCRVLSFRGTAIFNR